MKKLLSVLLAVCMVISMFTIAAVSVGAATGDDATIGADGTTVYLNATATSTGEEDFYAWTWADGENGAWIKGTGSAANVTFTGDIKANILFVRVATGATPSWDDQSVWNQTADLTTQIGGTYTTTGWQDNLMLGNWGTTPDPTPGTADYYVVGTMNNWAPAAAYKMTAGANNTYTFTGTFAANDGIKVGKSTDGTSISTWYPDGMDNETKITEAGTYTITFNASTGAFTVTKNGDDTSGATSTSDSQTTGDVCYLNATATSTGEEDFYAWTWATGENGSWIKGTGTAANVTFTGVKANILFVRVATGATPSWDDQSIWNQTNDLTTQIGGTFTTTGWQDAIMLGNWGTTPDPTPGNSDYYVVGTMNNWLPAAAYKMTAGANNTYTYTGTFAANDGIKVGKSTDGTSISTWYPDGMDNETKITEAGEYVVTFNASTGAFTVVKSGDEPTPGPDPTGDTCYLNATATSTGEEDFYAWTWATGENGSWIKGTGTAANVTFTGVKANILFVRVATGATPSWDDQSIWNQTNDLTTQIGGTFTTTGWQDSIMLGDWGTTPVPGNSDYYVVGTMNNWLPAAAYKMTAGANNTYTYTGTFAANDGIKVGKSTDGTSISTWYPDGMDNETKITEAGEYVVTFNATTGAFTVVKGGGPAPVVKGDVNNDGTFDIQDITALQSYLAEFSTLEGAQLTAADFNGDNTVDVRDVTAMQRNLAGLEGTPVPPVPTNTCYLNATATSTGEEDFYAWTWATGEEGSWIKGTGAASKVTFTGVKANILFVRVATGATPNWDDQSIWNQTNDLTTQMGGTFTTTGWQDAIMLGDWGTTPDPTPGNSDYYVVGTMNNWLPAAAYKMTAGANNTYTYTGTFAANDGLKVGKSTDGTSIATWYPDGMDNETKITEAGEYVVTFNATTGAFTVVKSGEPGPGPEPTDNTCYLNATATSTGEEDFYAWTWATGEEGTWIKGTGTAANVTFTGVKANILFVRVATGATPSWDDQSIWNQTADLTTQFGGTFTTTGWQDATMLGNWGAAPTPGPQPTDATCYLNATATSTGEEDFYAWTWATGEEGTWIKGTGTAANVTFTGVKANILFVRVATGATPSWDDQSIWNQTNDLTTQNGGTFTTTGWQDSIMLGNW